VSVSSEGELNAVVPRIVEVATERVEFVRKNYRRAQVDIGIRAVGLSLTPPALAASLASALGVGIFAPAGIALALGAFAAKTVLDWDKATSEQRVSPWSYVWDLRGRVSAIKRSQGSRGEATGVVVPFNSAS
jgi:hypothetical protein